jgi:DNA-binding CsgD family transcriptional regulator
VRRLRQFDDPSRRGRDPRAVGAPACGGGAPTARATTRQGPRLTQSLLDPADPIAPLALRSARTVASLLTSREREVAHLAARGLADRAIAEKLELSVRTVDTHLAGAYAKLGVQVHTDLTSVFTESPPREVDDDWLVGRRCREDPVSQPLRRRPVYVVLYG